MRELPADDVVVAGVCAGDEELFVLVVDSWSAGMMRVARAFVSTSDSAAEVVQDTWLAVVEGVERFEGRASLKTWVYRILVNTAKRRGAREGRIVPWSSVAGEDDGPTVDPSRFQGAGEPFPGHWRESPAPWPSPEQVVLTGEIRARLATALAQLPERQRAVITLRDVEGYPAEEVCAMLDITVGNQRVLLHRARAFVRAQLGSFGTRPWLLAKPVGDEIWLGPFFRPGVQALAHGRDRIRRT